MKRWVAAIALVLTACGGGDDAGEPPNPVDGLIVGLAGDELTLETAAGVTYTFTLGDPTVPFEHLEVHRDDRLPVRVTWTGSGPARTATTIADA